MLTVQYSYIPWPTKWRYSVKRLRMCKIVCVRKSTCMAQTKILTDSTRKRHKYEDFVYKLKKSVIPTIFQHVYGKHNLVSFYGRIVFWHRRFLYYSFFFQEKTQGDISFKLETKIMNFMTGFFFRKKYNQGNSSVVNNMRYNLFTIFPLSGPFAEFGFVFIDYITYFRF